MTAEVFVFRTYFALYDQTARLSIEAALRDFLTACGKAEYQASLNYLLDEVIGNADKANLKRAFFSLSGLDIHDPADYESGMVKFREALFSRQDELVSLVQAERSFVHVEFQNPGQSLVFSVANSCPLLPVEHERIQQKLKMARKFESIQEIMGENLDQSEGGGLGLMISVLMLRKIGLDETNLRFETSPQGTRVSLIVPLDLIRRQDGEIIARAVLEQVRGIPQFPANVLQILDTLTDPTKTFEDISHIIRKDPALIADVLKTANSSMYSLPRKVDSIEAAVRIIGVSTLRQLILVTVSKNLLTNRFKVDVVQAQMQHAAEVAYYATELARLVKEGEVAKNIFVCAMLHDLGKIIVDSIEPHLVERIEALCRLRGMNGFVAESLTNGYNHSVVGAELARQWNFPDHIVESIQYHHLPLEASPEHRRYVWITYLANAVAHYAHQELSLDQLSAPVVQALGLDAPGVLPRAIEAMVANFRAKSA